MSTKNEMRVIFLLFFSLLKRLYENYDDDYNNYIKVYFLLHFRLFARV